MVDNDLFDKEKFKELRLLWNSFKINRKDYYFNKIIFRLCLVLLLCWTVFLIVNNSAYLMNFNNPYFSCPESSIKCYNPLYNTCSDKIICQIEFFEGGFVYGVAPEPSYKFAFPVALFLFFIPYIINHLIYNRGKKFFLKGDVL